MYVWLVKTHRAPSRHCRDTRVFGHMTPVMQNNAYTPLPPKGTKKKHYCNCNAKPFPGAHTLWRNATNSMNPWGQSAVKVDQPRGIPQKVRSPAQTSSQNRNKQTNNQQQRCFDPREKKREAPDSRNKRGGRGGGGEGRNQKQGNVLNR